MRGVQWTDTWINDTTNTTLAYGELVQCFLIANKVLLKKKLGVRKSKQQNSFLENHPDLQGAGMGII